MKIKSMSASFGGLNKARLELGEGLNLISAPNEAGKSTWCAFLKAMLYGIDTRDRDKKNYLADKNRYQPWSGAPMEGKIQLEWQGREITLRRGPRGNTPFGSFSAVYTNSGEAVPELSAANCGQMLTGVGREVYERSAFIGQGGTLAITTAPELEKRIADLVTTGREDVSYAQTEQRLREMRNRRRVNRSVGKIPELEGQLEQVRTGLEAEREAHKRLAQRELDQRYTQAAEELSAAREQLSALEREFARFGPQPEERALLDAQNNLAYLKVLDEEIARGQEELKQAQEDYVQAQIALQEGPFAGQSAREAEERVQSDLKKRDQLRQQARRLNKRKSLLAVLAVLALAAAAACWFVLPEGEAVRLGAAGGGIALALLLGIFGAHSGKGGKAAALQGQEVLARYGVDNEEAVDALLREYQQRCRRAEECNDRCASVRGAVNDHQARRENTHSDLLDFVHVFAPEVSTLNGCSAALSRALKLGHDLEMARQKVAERQLRLSDLTAQGGKTAEGTEQPAAPARSREETERMLAAACAQLEQVDRELNQILGRQRAMGDPAGLSARQEQLREQLERKQGEYAAIDTALEALARANTRLRERFSPELNRRAGGYLSRLTGGKYDRLTLNRELEGAAAQAGDPMTRSALYLSQGTVDQLYLAVRLAVCELCLPQRPPIVLDDALADFDDGRAAQGLALLRELAEEQQVLLFTCHGREREQLKGAPDVTVLSL